MDDEIFSMWSTIGELIYITVDPSWVIGTKG